jgi:hypothetical protein
MRNNMKKEGEKRKYRRITARKKKKIKQSRYTPWRRLGGEEV